MATSTSHRHDYDTTLHHCRIPGAFLAPFPVRQLAMPPSGGIVHNKEQRQTCSPLPAAAERGATQDLVDLGGHRREVIGHEDCDEVRDCVIVGAGIAGLAAAADLERAGLNFVLLEAADRWGGRIFTHEESRYHYDRKEGGVKSRPLELGAQWLHGTDGNPLFEFCMEEGIFDSQEGRKELAVAKRAYTAAGFQARRPDGTLVSRREFMRHSEAWSRAVLEAETLYEASLAAEGVESPQQHQQHVGAATLVAATAASPTGRADDIRAAGRTPTANGHHRSPIHSIGSERAISTKVAGLEEEPVGAFLHRRVREILRADGNIDEGILGYLMRKQRAVEGCDDLNGVSIAGYGMYEELEGGDVRIPGGFSRVVDALAKKISPQKMRLQSPVTRVQWAKDDREWNEQSEGSSSRAENYPCVVEYESRSQRLGGRSANDSDGEVNGGVSTRRIRCRRVLVTVGLGVLKDGTALAFSPPLPSAKLSAIRRLGFGTTDKIFFRCTKKGAAGVGRAGPDPSLHVGVVRPAADEQQQQQQQQGGRQNDHRPLRWADDIFSFDAEGEYVYSWLTGPSARAAEEAERAGEVTDTLVSLLRTATQDPSWQTSPDPEELQVLNGGSAGPGAGSAAGMPLTPARQARDPAARSLPALVRSNWNSNPLFRGSYSYVATGSSPQDMEELAKPLSVSPTRRRANSGSSSDEAEGLNGHGSSTDTAAHDFGGHLAEDAEGKGGAKDDGSRCGHSSGDRGSSFGSSARVFFAGEAMHSRFFSTAHGGFETGRRAARDVLASCDMQDAAAALVLGKKAE
ncbi:unnamed protein product [Scytosiphon promiscuus]